MGKISKIVKSAKAPWTHLPSQHFEELRHLEHSELISPINLQVKESMYDLHPAWKMSYIWTQFEKIINSIFHDLRTIRDDETCLQVSIGTLHALQPKWLILNEMMESVNSLGYTDCHIFADKVDLLLFYSQQAETLVKETIEYIDFIFDRNLVIDLRKASCISIEEGAMENLYSGLFKTSITDESVEKCKLFIKSLESLPFLLRDCAYSQTYYLFKNTMGLFNNVDRFQQQDVGIYQYRRRIFMQDYCNALKSLGRREAVPNPESFSALREKAFSDTMHKSYSEVYQLYENCRGKLESLNDSRDYKEEGWLRAFFTDLFQTHYIGEQRDADGKITTVFIDERGNTSVEGSCGWERWLDFLTVISLVRDYEQKYLSLNKDDFLSENEVQQQSHYKYQNHYLMRHVHEDCKEKVIRLLEKLESYRVEGSNINGEIDKYEFDLKAYKKTQIFNVCKDIRSYLSIGKNALGQYLLDNTNLGKDSNNPNKPITLNTILNQI